METVRSLSSLCWSTLDSLAATSGLDVLSHLSVCEGLVAAKPRLLMEELLGRLSAEARSAVASRAQEAAYEQTAILGRLMSASGDGVSVGSAMGRLQAAVALLRGVEDSR